MFTHLHLHTEYSLLDGLSRIPQLLDRAKELGQEACAITDHGALYGVIDFYREARARDIKPIIGVEAYVAPGDRRSRDPKEKSPYHLTLLARSQQGYHNLLKLVTKANLEGYYYKPRMDRELLEAHGQGIIALSGCNSGEMHKYLLEGRREEALALASWSREVFDDYYLELQENGLPDVTQANKLLVGLAKETELPLVATCDSHYTYPEDASDHDVLLCIGTNSTIHEEKRMKMNAPVYYIQSESEVRARFSELPQAVDNTQRIADACDVTLEFGRLHLPDADLPAGVTAEEHLSNLAYEGLGRRYNPVTQEQRARLDYELNVVSETGFTNYFLVVYDIAMFARRAGIPMGVRGSAAASVILYCLGVTDVDPLRYRLVFERFLNVERREMPDVDFDFADDRRDEILRYTAQKYGSDRVAQIITFGTLGAKAAIRDVGRAFGMSFGDTDRIARLVPFAVGMTLEKALEQNQELGEAMDADPEVRKLVETAQRLEGVARHSSTHAAGVVISREPLVEHVSLQLPPRSDSEKDDALPTTQFAMNQVAEIGLLKLDVLGLVNLTILGRAVDLIKETRGIEIDLQALPDDDAQTFEMLSKGETFGVFQLESGGMRRSIQELRPSSIGDLSAMVALYRPGPMEHIPTFCKAKNGEQKISYPHKDLAGILDETYGVITYQDQVLLIAQKFAGYTLGEADVMRKAMGKKIADVMHAEHETFIRGAKRNGYSEGDAEEIFELIRPFAGYAFNKAHAVCYAMIAYQTGYLKTHYPAEYMVAVLGYASSHPSGGQSRIAAAAAECARLGILLEPPNVNTSGDSFTLQRDGDKESILFGLKQIKNVGAGAAESIVAEREANGTFESLEDFCRRIDLGSVNKRAMESMVKAGALSDFGERATMLANVERIMSLAQREQKLKESGQATMFDLFGDEVSTPMPAIEMEEASVPRKEELDWEKELLGLYVSEHPFKAAAGVLGPLVTAQCGELEGEVTGSQTGDDGEEIVSAALPPKGRNYTIAGMVGNTRRLYTRDGRPFCAAAIEDLSGIVEVTVWPELFEKTQDVWVEGNIVLLEVRVRERNSRLNISVQRVEQFDPETESTNYVPPTWLTKAAENPDPTPSYGSGNGNSYWKKPKDVRPMPPMVRASEPAAGPAPAPPKPPPPPAPSPNPPTVEESQTAVATAEREPTTAAAVESVTGLRVELRETDDEDADRDRLERLLGLLADFPGDEEVRLTVHTLDGQSQVVKLGKVRVTIDGELLTQLQDVLGDAGSVRA